MAQNAHIMQIGRWFVGEFIGTLVLAAVVGVTAVGVSSHPDYQVLFLPFAVGLTVMLMVYILGATTGSHLNPAVTVAMLVARKLTPVQAATYVVAQVIGALGGLLLARIFVGAAVTPPPLNDWVALVGEIVGAFILLFAISRVVYGRVVEAASGLVIGAAITIGVTVSLVASGGILNPAIALGIGAFTTSHLLGPLVGGLLGWGVARLLEE